MGGGGSAELRVLEKIADGDETPEIAEALVLSVNTVRSHIKSIYRRLDVHDRCAAVVTARIAGVLSSAAPAP